MSRIGNKPVGLLPGVSVSLEPGRILVKGPRGELQQAFPPGIHAELCENKIIFSRSSDAKQQKAYHGMTRSLVANMVKGVADGFEKKMQIVGVGYRAKMEEKNLVLNIGFSHPVVFAVPEDIQVKVEDNTKISISGISKQRVGEIAAQIRRFYPPEPYKGKGIRYEGEHVRRKAGKALG